mgnify:CR=1 FL=1
MSDKDVKIPEDLHEIVEKMHSTGIDSAETTQPPQQNDRFKRCGQAAARSFSFLNLPNTVFAKTVMDPAACQPDCASFPGL